MHKRTRDVNYKVERCSLCGIIIGDYRVGKYFITTLYKYPFFVRYLNKYYTVDEDCKEWIKCNPKVKKYLKS